MRFLQNGVCWPKLLAARVAASSDASNEVGSTVNIMHDVTKLLLAVFPLSVLSARGQLAPLTPNRDTALQLPEGAGKQAVERTCFLCHGFGQFARVNLDRPDWDHIISVMVAWGAPLRKEEIPVVIDYLATNFKDQGKGRGVVIPGNIDVAIKEWDLPTRAALPHDSLYSTRSGSVWYTGQFANVLGRFDPKTQEFEDYHLKRPRSEPYSLVEDKEGSIWFDSHVNGFIGRLDPKTGDVKEYPLPDPKLVLYDIAIDQKGILWFAAQHEGATRRPGLAQSSTSKADGSKIGRLDPKTGEIKFADLPGRNAAAYGIVVNSKGIPFFSEVDTPRLGSVDPDAMQVTKYLLPNPGIGTRRLALTRDDVMWYTDSRRGYLGQFDPRTGRFSEWPSPSGPRSYPYGITVVGNVIWYAEAESKPNMLVRFDPKTEKFQTWPVKAGGGIKNISPQPDGNLWLTRPLTNGISYVEIKQK